MKIFIVIGVAILVLIVWTFLKSKPIPSDKEIHLPVSEDKMATEISLQLVKQYEDVSIEGEDIKRTFEDCEDLWKTWLENGYVPGDKLAVDFYFYSASEENATKLKRKLEQEGFHVDIYPETTMVILKGWKIKTQIRREWDLETFKQYSKTMAAIGQKEGPYLEGSAALLKPAQEKTSH